MLRVSSLQKTTPRARPPPGMRVSSLAGAPTAICSTQAAGGLRVVTMQNRKALTEDELDELWKLDEPRKSREELLADPDIIPEVKKLIERSSFVEQRTDPWFKMRKGRVTGSATAAILGHNPYQSRKKLLDQKLGLGPPFTGNKATRHGNRFEPWAALAYQKKTGLTLIECDLGLMIPNGGPYEKVVGASCDGVTKCGILIEIKCPYRRKITGRCPSHYLDQIQLNLYVHNLQVAHFIDFNPPGHNGLGEICEVSVIKRDHKYMDLYGPAFIRFQNDLLAGLKEQKKKKNQGRVLSISLSDSDDEDEPKKKPSEPTTFMFI